MISMVDAFKGLLGPLGQHTCAKVLTANLRVFGFKLVAFQICSLAFEHFFLIV